MASRSAGPWTSANRSHTRFTEWTAAGCQWSIERLAAVIWQHAEPVADTEQLRHLIKFPFAISAGHCAAPRRFNATTERTTTARVRRFEQPIRATGRQRQR